MRLGEMYYISFVGPVCSLMNIYCLDKVLESHVDGVIKLEKNDP